jgi:hypothetical protein
MNNFELLGVAACAVASVVAGWIFIVLLFSF